MIPEPTYLLKRIRRLSQALLVSGAINISVLGLLSYWIVRERPPTPYFELKPASQEQQQMPLANPGNCREVIVELQSLSFDQLVNKLDQTQLIENGYTERDLALSCLVAFHYFDIVRALPKDSQPVQQRMLMSQNRKTGESVSLVIYAGLTESQFNGIKQFAKTEHWPMTSEGLFTTLQKQKAKLNIDPSLVEAFMLTPDFMTIELLFKRIDVPVSKQRLIEVILEGDWSLLNLFVDQQKQLNDLSAARRQKFILDYIRKGSETAAYLLLDLDEDFAIKKLDDHQAIAFLQLLPKKTMKSERFALAMLTSPRTTSVWQQASLRLYEYAGEPIPDDWDYRTSLKRFAPHKIIKEETTVKSVSVNPPSSTSLVANQASIKPVKVSNPIPPSNKNENKAVVEAKSSTISSNATIKKETTAARKSPPQCRLYIVQEGDSLWKISRRFGVDMEVLKERNQLQSTAIKPGTVLKIP